MRKLLVLLLLAPILLVVLWLALGRGTPAPAPQAAPRAPVAEEQAAPPAQVESAPATPEASRVEAASAPERASVAAAEPDKAEVKLAELRGRFVLEGGAPALGTKVQLQGWESNNELVMKYGKPKDWKNLSAVCDAEGRFSLRFDPPRAYQFFLETSYPGCVSAKWRWGQIEPASTKDLGEVTLPRGGAIAGRVLDAQGNPMHDAWSVSADARAVASGDGSDATRGHAEADKATGQFRIEDLPPGNVELSAYSQLANQIAGPKVVVRAGETVEADIRYTGPDNSRRITVSTSTRPFYAFGHDIEAAVLSAPGKQPRKAAKIARSSSSYSFDDLEPGSYSITIDDPKFKPWRQDGVQPGQRVSAKLQGASSVSLAVIDAATRAPVAHYALRVRFEKVNFSPSQFEVFGADKEPPVGGLVEGLIPADQTLIVVAEGYAPCELPLGLLKAGELRPLTAELRKGATLVARVLQADGKTPIAGSRVTLDPFVPAGEAQHTSIQYLNPPNQREATSAADGRASFPAVLAGAYTLRAELTPLLAAELKGCEVALADTQKEVDLVLPPNGWLAGRVLGLEPAAAESCSLVIVPADLPDRERVMLRARVQLGEQRRPYLLGADGSFRAGPLRAGKSSVSLQFPEVKVEDGPNSRWSQPGTEIALGEVEIPAGGELQREFDLRGKIPGRVEADVRVNGAPAADARVSVRSANQEQRGGEISLDANGHGTSAPIAVGPVRFDISATDGEWSWTPPGSWTIASGETLRVQWDVALASGSLQLVDEVSGAPLAEREVSIRAEAEADGFASWVQRSTDKQGKLELRLVPAAYRIDFTFDRGPDGKLGQSPYQGARFDWTASGPASALLKIAKKP
jgi:hypothetical protein